MPKAKFIAASILVAALLCGPSVAEEHYELKLREGFALLKEGKVSEARNRLTPCAREDFLLVDYADFGLAESYFKEKDYLQALQGYQQVMELHPESALVPLCLLQSGKCYYNLKDFKKAEKIFHRIIGDYELSAAVAEASDLLEKTKQAAAESSGQKASAADQKIAAGLELDSSETLKRLYSQASKKRYRSKYATYYGRFCDAVNYWANQDYPRASAAFKKMYDRYPGTELGKYSYFMYGRAELRKGNIDLAVQIFKKSAGLGGSGAPEALYYLSFAYAYVEDESGSIGSLEKLVTRYPASPYAEQAAYQIGQKYEKRKQSALAVRAYQKFLARFPKSTLADDASARLGFLYYETGKAEQAYSFLNSAYQKYTQRDCGAQISYWLAKCADSLGKSVEAAAAYQQTIQTEPHSYYACRAEDQLKKRGLFSQKKEKSSIDLSLFKVKEKQEEEELSHILDLWGALRKKQDYSTKVSLESLNQNPHYQKYLALYNLGLYKFAAIEAADLAQEEKVLLPLSKVLFAIGEFRGPAVLADTYIKTEISNGRAEQIPSEIWPIAYPLAFWDEVTLCARQHQLDPYFVLAVMREESYFGSSALSRARAHGLMQIMPRTGKKLAELLGMDDFSTQKLFNPQTNIQMGAYYLSDLLKRFEGSEELALAAYNGGPNRVKKWVGQMGGGDIDVDVFVESIPLRETRNYVKKVMQSYRQYQELYANQTG